MQISQTTYVDIEIHKVAENRSFVTQSEADFFGTSVQRNMVLKDFLQADDLVDLQIIETAGSSLPIIYVAFLSDNNEVINSFVRQNTIIVKVGTSAQHCDSFVVSIYSSSPPNNGPMGERRLVEFGGFILNQDFMVNFESNTYFGNSLLVAQAVLKKHLGATPKKGFLTGISKVNENQVKWMQSNTTPCLFLAETLIHMDIRPSFPLFAFDKYGTFHLNDFNKVWKAGPKVNFVSRPPQKLTEIQYINNFSVDDFKDMYNLYSGFNKITEIWGAKEGITTYAKSYNEPILASTKETDMLQSGNRTSVNVIQSANVHSTYVESFVHNTNKLVALSSLMGVIELSGNYFKDLKPTDLVSVSTGGADVTADGMYLIDTIRTQVDMQHGGMIHTYIYVTRDNKNNIENYIANPKKGLKILKKAFATLMNAVSQLRVAYAMGQRIVDGSYMKEVMSFALETKRNLLRSFTVAGVGIDFNSSANLLKSLTCVGNSLMNTLVSMILPSAIADTFRDFILRKPSLKSLLSKYIAEFVPPELQSIISLLSDSLFETTNTLNSIAKSNGIRVTADDTAGNAIGTDSVTAEVGEDTVIDNTNTSEIDYTSDSSEKVQNVTEELINNSSWLGLDIPFPILDLTESQSLMSYEELKKYVADQTVANLTNLGYMKDLTEDQIALFEDILLGEKPVEDIKDVNELARQINQNAGNTLYYRYWGTFGQGLENILLYAWTANDKFVYTDTVLLNANSALYNFNGTYYEGEEFLIEKEGNDYRVMYIDGLEKKRAVRSSSKDKKDKGLLGLTNYYVKKCYKDKYRTLPCTKLINATQNARIFFACPSSEEDLRFYVNSKRVDIIENLEEREDYISKPAIGYFPIDLGFINGWGMPVPYTVYYTNLGYNSNSVLFEVKQGGMV